MAREGLLGSDERVALVVTGNGLKDIASARKAVGEPLRVEPSLAALEKALG
jgi:threonine synthase